jgi:hypothetical protein
VPPPPPPATPQRDRHSPSSNTSWRDAPDSPTASSPSGSVRDRVANFDTGGGASAAPTASDAAAAFGARLRSPEERSRRTDAAYGGGGRDSSDRGRGGDDGGNGGYGGERGGGREEVDWRERHRQREAEKEERARGGAAHSATGGYGHRDDMGGYRGSRTPDDRYRHETPGRGADDRDSPRHRASPSSSPQRQPRRRPAALNDTGKPVH